MAIMIRTSSRPNVLVLTLLYILKQLTNSAIPVNPNRIAKPHCCSHVVPSHGFGCLKPVVGIVFCFLFLFFSLSLSFFSFQQAPPRAPFVGATTRADSLLVASDTENVDLQHSVRPFRRKKFVPGLLGCTGPRKRWRTLQPRNGFQCWLDLASWK